MASRGHRLSASPSSGQACSAESPNGPQQGTAPHCTDGALGTSGSPSAPQLGQLLAYKARRAGVPVVFIDPAYTSQQRSKRMHTN
ncbi:zinc ribbon domain-containing protein [Streptomyces sp. NPDC004008]